MRSALLVLCLILSGCGVSSGRQDNSVTHITERKEKRALTGPLVIVDAGHGGCDSGAHTREIREKEPCLLTALMVKHFLNEKGYRVKLTRHRDDFIPLKKRASVANSSKAEAFVSIHFNAAKAKEATGIEVYYYPGKHKTRLQESKRMAQSVLTRMVSRTGARNRGVKKGNFCVIRETKMPAILIEGGFITNPKEGKLIENNKYLEKIARGAAEGVDRYFKHR
ncbi:MAG: N-acetylmuramoyl-L-alanine amidase [Simkaniaceae bacterium]|nr:N-acetylmuramoyl-L-alanine amidase [Simkaniaceae bacterium]